MENEAHVMPLSWDKYNELIKLLGPNAEPVDYPIREGLVVRGFKIKCHSGEIIFVPAEILKKYGK